MLEIVEILRPSVQGRNKAFMCRGEDDQLYYVKGKNAGRRRQCCEWVAGNLGKEFGLPIPDFQLVTIPEVLLADAKKEFQEIGEGIAFASLAQDHAQWFEQSFVDMVPAQERSDVLVFDWWVQNDDRLQDNPNLLWDTESECLHVIDHDSAFSPDFFPTVFRNYHIFRGSWDHVFSDLVAQAEYRERMEKALSILDEACDNVPTDWIDHSGKNADLFNPRSTRAILEKCLTPEIWEVE